MDHIADQREVAVGKDTLQPTFMELLEELLEGRRELFLDLIRIYLGIGLIAKGVFFLVDRDFVGKLLLQGTGLDISAAFLAHYIPLAHIAGGLLMLIGFLTRFGALLQLPILFGAVFFVHLREGLFTRNQSLEFTALVLFLLVVFAITGAGKLSLDHHFSQRRDADSPA